MLLIGRNLTQGVYSQGAGVHPNFRQIEAYMMWPAYVLLALLTCAWVCNALRRWPLLLGSVSGAAIVALLPYLLAYTGGV